MSVKSLTAKVTHTTPINKRNIYNYSPTLNVTLASPSVGTFGEADYSDLTLEFKSIPTTGTIVFYLVTEDTTVKALIDDITITDPDGVMAIGHGTADGTFTISTTGIPGLVSLRFPAKFNTMVIWNLVDLNYPVLKGFRSFGNTLRNMHMRMAYNYEVPSNIPPTLEVITFGVMGYRPGRFNDPKVSNWDVSNLLPESFDTMFINCSEFNQDLSGWCVSQVTSPPVNFSLNSALTPANHPVWGTCPVKKVTTVTLNPGLVQQGPYIADDNYTFKSFGYNTDPMYNIAGTLLPNKIVTAAGATVTIKYINVTDLTKTSTGQIYTTSEIATDGNLGNKFKVVLNGVTYVYQLMEVLAEYGYFYSINPNGYIDPSQLSLPCPDFRQATTFDIIISV